MFAIDDQLRAFIGPKGMLEISQEDDLLHKLMMIVEGECGELGPIKTAEKYGFSKQRYYQVLHTFKQEGVKGLAGRKRGPKSNYRCTEHLERTVIQYRFLDPDISASVITQKLKQQGFSISMRSVERVIAKYGLQKKTASAATRRR